MGLRNDAGGVQRPDVVVLLPEKRLAIDRDEPALAVQTSGHDGGSAIVGLIIFAVVLLGAFVG